MPAITVQIRLLQEGEIGLLERHMAFGPPEKHRERFQMQERGKVLYLVAWIGRLPVGHVLVNWEGTPDEPMASSLADCPDIEDLFVSPEHRRERIGTRLMDAAEESARTRGYHRVGLGVAVDNHPARTLYEGRGYVDAGYGEYPHCVEYVDSHGNEHCRLEICIYMIKGLGGDHPRDGRGRTGMPGE